MKRRDNECYYDYQARRLMEQRELKIYKMGTFVHVSHKLVEKEVKGVKLLAKQIVGGTYVKEVKE